MKNILLLHGAIGAKQQLEPMKKSLDSAFTTYSLNFGGHGGEPMQKKFSIAAFAEEVRYWMKENKLEKISIFGYSMRGYVGLYHARFYPELIDSIITLGTKLHWDESIAAKEAGVLNPDVIEQKVPKFASQLTALHRPLDWKEILHQTAAMLKAMGTHNPLKEEDFEQIQPPVLLLLGDRDKMVTLDETVAVYKQLASAQLGVLPNTIHPIDAVDVGLLSSLIKKFLQ
jgi:pimeloyl-ACP methyl ester carboxylesterase